MLWIETQKKKKKSYNAKRARVNCVMYCNIIRSHVSTINFKRYTAIYFTWYIEF